MRVVEINEILDLVDQLIAAPGQVRQDAARVIRTEMVAVKLYDLCELLAIYRTQDLAAGRVVG
jgi:hypothetical protein